MYAIINDGGKQYSVSPGQLITVEKKELKPGSKVEFPEVVYYRYKEDIRVGAPKLEKVKVEGIVEKQVQGPKLTVFKFRRRKDSSCKTGHRQKYTSIRISSITAK